MLFCSVKDTAMPANIPVELRLDLWPHIDLAIVKQIVHRQPVLLTVRSQAHGGKFQGSETQREALLEELIALGPAFMDLEYDMRPGFLQAMISRAQCILSYHNRHEVPADLENIYQQMQYYDAFTYKIAAQASSTSEALRLLLFAKTHARCCGIAMGKGVSFARVLGPIVGNCIGYASHQEECAPGQLTLAELYALYRYPTLNRATAIYGLIGDPIEQSIGHLYHNAQLHGAVYVKMTVTPEELSTFIPLAKALGVRGLSVTAPLKEAIIPFVDVLDSKMGAVNTLRFDDGRIVGTNTDGAGALDAIEKRESVTGKTIVLLGAGGVARSIAFEAKVRGAFVHVLSRTVSKAEKFAADMGCKIGLPSRTDILVNCMPEAPPVDFHPEMLVMDCVYVPPLTPFLRAAAQKGCRIVSGEELFFNQAARQIAFWMGA
jgi:3-dehydroquinate dehydratase/shikimate dehydrogenase